MATEERFQQLELLLQRRIEVIGDADWRERDPDTQLAELVRVGEALFAAHAELKGKIPPRLEHFLSGCSYDKALAFIRES